MAESLDAIATVAPVDLPSSDADDAAADDSPGQLAAVSGADGEDGTAPAAATGPAVSVAPIRVDARPRYKSNPLPEYPYQARLRRWTGEVLLLVEVDAAGKVTNLSVERSSGYALLDRAASHAVRRWEFLPAREVGLPVSSRVRVPVSFQLEGS